MPKLKTFKIFYGRELNLLTISKSSKSKIYKIKKVLILKFCSLLGRCVMKKAIVWQQFCSEVLQSLHLFCHFGFVTWWQFCSNVLQVLRLFCRFGSNLQWSAAIIAFGLPFSLRCPDFGFSRRILNPPHVMDRFWTWIIVVWTESKVN